MPSCFGKGREVTRFFHSVDGWERKKNCGCRSGIPELLGEGREEEGPVPMHFLKLIKYPQERGGTT